MKLTNIALLTALLGLNSCAYLSNGEGHVSGFIYSDQKNTVQAVENKIGSKVGMACASSILGLVGTGDNSLRAAAAKAGVTKIATVDREVKNILSVYSKRCTIVTGE